MILTLDVGNSQIFGGVFDRDQLVLRFRKSSKQILSSDELGLFLKQVLRENDLDPRKIEQVGLCSVVPDLIHTLKNTSKKYFGLSPFILQAGVKTGLKIKYRNPIEVGADRIANAIGALQIYPEQNLIIVDFGTATTFCAINSQKEYLGGLILPGLRISMEALEMKTAKLPSVEILRPDTVVGRSTIESIQSGLYFGNLAIIREVSNMIRREAFQGEKAILIGTGGFSRLFDKEKVFDALLPDLVLQGLQAAMKMNL